jgi:hypothetical protein
VLRESDRSEQEVEDILNTSKKLLNESNYLDSPFLNDWISQGTLHSILLDIKGFYVSRII